MPSRPLGVVVIDSPPRSQCTLCLISISSPQFFNPDRSESGQYVAGSGSHASSSALLHFISFRGGHECLNRARLRASSTVSRNPRRMLHSAVGPRVDASAADDVHTDESCGL